MKPAIKSTAKSTSEKGTSLDSHPLSAQFLENTATLLSEARRQKIPMWVFWGMCFNLVIAPMVQASTGEALSRGQAWAIGILGLCTLAVSVYLFVVMFQPERF